MFEIANVSHRFGACDVLKDVNLSITEHRIGIIGANGSGKSTFARLLNGLLIPDEGTVTVDGIDTREDAKAVRRRVGFVFQNPDNQIVFPVVEEDVAFGLRNLKLPKEEIARRVDTVLARYRLGHLRDRPTHLLSGGEKQMLAISAVLVMEPRYVVLGRADDVCSDLRNKQLVIEIVPRDRAAGGAGNPRSRPSPGLRPGRRVRRRRRRRRRAPRCRNSRIPAGNGVMLSLYVPGDSFVHRLPAGTKLLALLAASVGAVRSVRNSGSRRRAAGGGRPVPRCPPAVAGHPPSASPGPRLPGADLPLPRLPYRLGARYRNRSQDRGAAPACGAGDADHEALGHDRRRRTRGPGRCVRSASIRRRWE